MKTLLTYFLLLLTFFFCSCRNDYEVVRVHDGDTFYTSTGEKIRLSDIDCPEIGQTYGEEAKAFTSSSLLHKRVSIKKVGTDKYGRTLAVIYLEDGTNFNELATQRGQGQISYKYCHNRKLIEEMETAKRNRIGLWAKENVAPFIYRKNKKK